MELMIKEEKGFKRTEIGLIPSEWSFEEIGPKIDLLSGNPFSSSGYSDHGIRLLRGANIKRGNTQWDDDNTKYWPENDPSLKKYKLKPDDLVIAMDGSLVGRSYAFLSEHDVPSFLLQRVARIRSEKIDTKYLKYFVGSSWFVDYCDSVKTNTAIPHISSSDIKNFKIPLPPTLEEQQAIASALSDVDELIRSLDRLIQKKEAIKKGTMQQLLTGKKRLPGFDGEKEYKKTDIGELPKDWNAVSLPDFCWFQEGPGLRKWQFTKKGMKVINVTNLQSNGKLDLDKTDRHISIEEFESSYNHFEIDEGDFVMASSGNSYCKTSIVRKVDLPLMMNTSVIRFKASDGLDYTYMIKYLASKYFKDQIDLLITGGAQPNFGPYHLNRILLPLPSSIEEQKAIAQILSDMDRELQTLRQKREKYMHVKQGMMQELLTGEVRLV